MIEHTTSGLPWDSRPGAERAYDLICKRGYMYEVDVYRAVLPEGAGSDHTSVWRGLQQGPVASGTLVMVWTMAGHAYYVTPIHALRIADRLRWVEDRGETVPVVTDASAFAL